MKRFDPAVSATERHYRVKEIAEMLGIGMTCARELMKAHPRVKYLPATKRGLRRTVTLPESALKDMYINVLKGVTPCPTRVEDRVAAGGAKQAGPLHGQTKEPGR